MSKQTADEIIARLDLQLLPGEGGFFRQTWIRDGIDPEHPVGTCIYYLVTPESFSALHRLADDEIFHFYLGDPCNAVSVDPHGNLSRVTLGPDVSADMHVQHIVPAGCWQGLRLHAGGDWALLGTTMAPGYHVSRFELATDEHLSQFDDEVRAAVREFMASPS